MGMDYPALLRENQSFRSDYPAEIMHSAAKNMKAWKKNMGFMKLPERAARFYRR